jgi:hypothetical protein
MTEAEKKAVRLEARASRLLIVAGLLALLAACESLPDEKALAVNDPAFFREAPCGPNGASDGTLKRHAPKDMHSRFTCKPPSEG